MMMSPSDCMLKALEMDAKAATSTYEPAKALYHQLAEEWRYSHDRIVWQGWTAIRAPETEPSDTL